MTRRSILLGLIHFIVTVTKKITMNTVTVPMKDELDI